MKLTRSRSRWVIGAALTALVLTSGCTKVRTRQGYLVDELLAGSIQPGIDNKASVEGTLGRPTFASQFGPEEWFYVSRNMRALAFAAPSPVEQKLIRIRFDAAGNVIGVERTGLEQVARIKPNGDKTATLGKDRSLLDEIFGNIGSGGALPAGGSGGGPNGS